MNFTRRDALILFSGALLPRLAMADVSADLTVLFSGVPWVTQTKHHKPGDAMNVGLVGSVDQVNALMQAIGWKVPDKLSIKSDAEIAASVALRRAYQDAPVSRLYYQGRMQDLAFEQEVGKSAKQRHHVRFWKLRDDGPGGKPLWLGAVTFDKSVGLSHRSGLITHHIDGDIDKERALLAGLWQNSGMLIALVTVKGQGTIKGKNGGGDAYFSDGDLRVGIIK